MSKLSKRAVVSLVAALTVALCSTGVWLIASADAAPALSCTDSWTGPTSGSDWNTPADWSSGAVPSSTDLACWDSGTTIDVGATDMGASAATAGSVQGGSLDIDGTSADVGEFTLAMAGSTSTLVNVTIGIGDLEGPGGLAISGNFVFSGQEPGVTNAQTVHGMIGYPTSLAISQTGNGTFQLGESNCTTSYIDATILTSSPVNLGCSYVLPYGGSLTTTSTVTLTPGAYPAAAGSRMNVTAQGYVISSSTAPQDFNLFQDGGITTIPTGDNFTPGVGFTLDSGEIVLDGPNTQFMEIAGTLSNGLTMNGGTLTGIGSVNGEVVQNGGVVEPGQSGTGTLTVLNYDQTTGGTLQIDISGTAPADYARLTTTAAELAGSLDLSPTSGYAAAAAVGDTFDVLSYGSGMDYLTGTFSTATSAPALQNGETVTADYSTAQQVDAVVTAPTGTPSTTTPSTTTPSTTTPSTTTPSTTTPSTTTPSTTTPTTTTTAQTTTSVNIAGPGVGTRAPTGTAAVSGTPLPGDTLTCNPGIWTGSPTFTYQWERGSTPISGATVRTYTVTILDEGSTVTCVLTGHNSAGSATAIAAGLVVAQAGTLKCPRPTGSFSPEKVGPFALGEGRAAARKSFHDYHVIQSGFDNFCLFGGWGIRGAYKANRFVFLDTANPYYKLKNISPGDTLKALAAQVKIGKEIVIGLNDWYVATGTTSNYVFKSRRGIVDEIGIANQRDTTGRAAQKRFLSSFKATSD